MSSKIVPAKPFVLMMYGFPGAGKTHLARQLAEEVDVAHLQEDKIIFELFGGNVNPNTKRAARKIMDYMAQDYLTRGISVIYDTEIIRASQRKKVREMAHAAKATALLVWLQVDPETTFARVTKRDHRKTDDRYAFEYDEDTYRDILSHMQNPLHENYVVISGKHTYVSQKSVITNKLRELGVLTADAAKSSVVKPELMNLVPNTKIQMRGDIMHRNISIRQ